MQSERLVHGQKLRHFDLIVVGSGAGGLTASVVAARLGLKVLLVESSEYIGGTSALSGGIAWIPCNPLMVKSGTPDTREAARRYLRKVVGHRYRGSVVEAYLDNGPQMVDFLLRETEMEYQSVPWPDYYPGFDGALPSGRAIAAVAYDGRRLGDKLVMLRPPLPNYQPFGTLMLDVPDFYHFLNATKSLVSFKHAARVTVQYLVHRLAGHQRVRLTLGSALVARLFRSCLDAGVQIWTNSRAKQVLQDASGRVTGIAIEQQNTTEIVNTRRGVVLASGGFSHDPELRHKYYPHPEAHPTMTVATDRGDGYRMGVAANAAIGDDVCLPFIGFDLSTMISKDGARTTVMNSGDRTKPGIICVNAAGRRFVNEALPAHDFVQRMLADGVKEAFLICGHGFIRRYGLGAIKPGPALMRPLRRHLESGYLVKGDSAIDIARKLVIDPIVLERTIARFNWNARTGGDPDFDKGGDIHQRATGDPNHKPNPCVGPLGLPPYYAIRVYPGDIGSSVGLRTDGHSRVLKEDGAPIEGLFACGLDSYSIMSGTNPSGGCSIGPAMVMGYIAARKAAEKGTDVQAIAPEGELR